MENNDKETWKDSFLRPFITWVGCVLALGAVVGLLMLIF